MSTCSLIWDPLLIDGLVTRSITLCYLFGEDAGEYCKYSFEVLEVRNKGPMAFLASHPTPNRMTKRRSKYIVRVADTRASTGEEG